MISRVKTTIETPEFKSSEDKLEYLVKITGRIYDELRRSQEAHEKEQRKLIEEHEKEILSSKRNNWFFCILSAVIGYLLAKFL